MADISKLKLPDGTTYDLKDSYVRTNYRALNNNDFDTINVTELNAGDLVVTGAARFLNTINGSISGNAVTATKATQDESGNNIKASYASSISISDHTITLKNKNGVSLGTVTVPDNTTDNTKLPLAGGTMTGTPKFAANSISEFSGNVPYILGIEAFADGGAVKWKASNNVTVGSAIKATQDGSGNVITSTYLPLKTAGGIAYCSANGANNYFQIATITIGATYVNYPIVFELSGRGHVFTKLDVMFTNTNNTDPGLKDFVTDGYDQYWIKKTATSTWVLYGKYSEVWGGETLHRISGMGFNKVTVTVDMTNYGTTAPSDATQVVYGWNCDYATSAGIATSATNDSDGNAINTTYVKKAGDTMSGELINQKGGIWVQGGSAAGGNVDRMTLTSGMPTELKYNSSKRGLRLYSNAIAIADPYNGNTNTDAGWLRHIEETSNIGVLELAVGDDGNESIVMRQYNTSSAIAREAKILDTNGTTSFPVSVTAPKFIGALQGNADTATTASKLSGFTSTTTSATAVDSATQNGHVYVNGTSGIYNQSDGACFVQAYSTSWVAQIYQDYRTGQIALRGRNNGTWQAWRKVWDSVNLKSETAVASGTTLSLVTTGEKYTWNSYGSGSARDNTKVAKAGDTMSGNLTVTNVLGIAQTAGTSGGISLYSDTSYVNSYGVAFRLTSNLGKHGFVQGDWATYFTMDGPDNRGWVFRNAAGKGNVASVSSAGNAAFNGSVTIGANTTNTSGVRQVYNSTTKSLDFVFVA